VRSEDFTAVKIQDDVFRVVTLCSVAVGHQRFTGPCSEVLPNVGVSYRNNNPEDLDFKVRTDIFAKNIQTNFRRTINQTVAEN
jgi:hypothetical protein